MSIFGDPSADVVVSQQAWIAITAEAEKLAAMAKECAAERQALRADRDELQCTVTRRDIAISGLENQVKSLRARVAELEADAARYRWLRDESRKHLAWSARHAIVSNSGQYLDSAIDEVRLSGNKPASLPEGT